MYKRQELAHGKIFYDHLVQAAGQTIVIDGSYPVDLADNLLDLLPMAHHNEMQAFEEAYPEFARIAEEEGLSLIHI